MNSKKENFEFQGPERMPSRMLCNGTEQKSLEARSGLILTPFHFTRLHKNRYGIPESEEIDVWEPVLTKGDSNTQFAQDYVVIHTIGTEEVELWMTVNQELMRQEITRQLMKLYTISFLVGLVVFVFTQNNWLLAALLLPVLIRWIVEYYFRRPKK